MGTRGTNIRNSKAIKPEVAADSAEAAKEAGLRYVTDERPGYTRKPKGKHFEYFDTEGKLIRDEQRLLRIKRLAIPPAWTDVWICPSAKWPHPSDRSRRAWAQAIPVSRALARSAR